MKKKPKWNTVKTVPKRRGWYITRTDQGDIQWRAWGCGAWWKRIKGGWLEWFTGDGEAVRYEWDANSKQDINLELHQLPEIKL